MTTTDRIVAAIDETGTYDPHVISKAVIAGLKRTEYAGALEEALPFMVRAVLGNLRRSPHPGHTVRESHNHGAGVGTPSSPGGAAGPTRTVCGSRRPGKSFYAKHLGVFARPYGTADGYKPLGDCVLADLDFIIADRQKRAAANTEEAEKITKLRALMRRKKAVKVSDLPVEGVEKCLR